MKKFILLFICLALFCTPAVVVATTNVDPVMITLDMPNQSVTGPTSGITMVDFTGTVFVDSNYRLTVVNLDFPNNSSESNFLFGTFNTSFLSFFSINGNGTYIGSIFEIQVPAGTPPDLYAFEVGSGNPAMFTAFATPLAQAYGAESINGAADASDSAAFSVLVNGNGTANGVPDRGSSMLLLGASLVALGVIRRVAFTT